MITYYEADGMLEETVMTYFDVLSRRHSLMGEENHWKLNQDNHATAGFEPGTSLTQIRSRSLW